METASAASSPATRSARSGEDFRRDINGLRAWAVALVVLFHLRVPGFDGGFIGVDVFFVISGYLMTRIILGSLDRGSFRFLRFYWGRVIRIVPALSALCAVLLACGWFALSAAEYEELAREAMTSLVFVSNFLFLSQAGYFDAASHDKWLLHTWSLSIEAQFYLTYPVLLFALWSWRRNLAFIRSAVLGLAGVSLAASALISPVDQPSAFFLLPTRAWQLFGGGLLFFYFEQWRMPAAWRQPGEILGLGVIVACAVWMDSDLSWPGAWAVLPVVAAGLVLAARRQDSLLTSTWPAQWLGLRSYSIYLWHWPLVVALEYLQLAGSIAAKCVALASALLLGHLSYRLVEQWTRFPKSPSGLRRRGIAIILLSSCIGCTALAIAHSDGVDGRMPSSVDLASRERDNRHATPVKCFDSEDNPGSACMYGGVEVGAIIVGDSHALSVVSAMAAAAPQDGIGVLAWIYPSCGPFFAARPVPGVFRSGLRCPEFNRWILGQLDQVAGNVPVVLVNRSSAYLDGRVDADQRKARPPLQFGIEHPRLNPVYEGEFADDLVASACRLARDRVVYLMRPIPEMPAHVPRAAARSLAMGVDAFPSVRLDEYGQRHAVVLAAQDRARDECGIRILDPRTALCSTGECVSVVGGRPLYYDDDHLSEFGNKKLVPMFREVFNER